MAVVDTGLDRFHPDIAANVWVNPGEDVNGDGIASPEDRNGLDDDGNGFVDDLTGFDFADSTDFDQDGFFDGPEDLSDADPFDERGHGTHVAGTIAAVANNGLGIAGVAPRARIMALKAFPAEGSASDSVLWRAVLYAAENGATVVNNSWSCSEPCPSNPLAEDVLAHVEALGAVVVTSAGNRTEDVVFRSPENTDRVITVGAVGYDERLASFSNRGWGVDVVAPGGEPSVSPGVRVARRNILSLLTSAVDPADEVFSVDSQYLRLAGTSMSSPHVAGAVALLQSLRPELRPADIRRLVRRSARDLGLPGHDPIYAAGLLDVPSLLSSELPDAVLEIDAPRSASRHDPELGPIAVRVRVGGQDFEALEIDVAPGLQGRAFLPLESYGGPRSTPLVAGDADTLEATWDARSLSDGPYVLRFRARLRDGTALDEYVVLAIERLTPLELADGERTVSQPAIGGSRVAWPMKPSADPLAAFELAIGRLRTTAARPRASDETPTPQAPFIVETAASPSDVSVDGSIVAWRVREGADTRLEWCRLTDRSRARRMQLAPLLRRVPAKPAEGEAIEAPPRDCEVRAIEGLAGTFSRPWVENGWIVWQRDVGLDRAFEGCRISERSNPKRSHRDCVPTILFAPGEGPRWTLRSFDGRKLLLQAAGQLAFCSLSKEDGARACQPEPIRFAPGTPPINEPVHDGALLVFDDVTIESRPPVGCLAGELSPECVPNFAVVAQHRACWVDPASGLCDSIPISSAVRVERMAGLAVSGRRIVWSLAEPLSQPSLRFCEFQTQSRECVEQRLVSSLASQDSPSIDGNRVVWRGARGAAPSIWGYALPRLESPERAVVDGGRPVSIPLRADRGTSRRLRYEIEQVGAVEGELDPIARALRVVDPGWPGGRVFLRGAIPRRAAGVHSLRVRAVGEAGLFSESIIELTVDASTNDGARKSGSTLRALRRWLSDGGRVRKPGL